MSKYWDTPFGPSEVIFKESLQVPETSKEKAKSFTSLEEAAEKYIQGTLCDLDDGPTVGLAKNGFIAGAEWQKGQDEPYMKRNNLELSLMLENARKSGILEGKAEMMKETVEGYVSDVIIHVNGDELKFAVEYPIGKRPYSMGDKVKILIVKQ